MTIILRIGYYYNSSLFQKSIIGMAFVIKSQKKSCFDSTANQSPQPQYNKVYRSVEDERIHVEADSQYRRLLGQKSKGSRRLNPNNKSQPSIPNQNKQLIFIQRQPNKRKCYDFRHIKKRNYQNKSNQSVDSSRQQITQYYDKPGSLSPKTMVKYMKTRTQSPQSKISTSISPGPGSYYPKIPQHSSQSPIFKPGNISQIDYFKQVNQDQFGSQQQKLFAVRYKTMNSTVFKKAPNLINLSNKNLINKLFINKENKTQEDQQIDDCQYIRQNKICPGPGQYHQNSKLYKKGVLFGNTKRFATNLSDGSNKYYNISQNITKNKTENQVPLFGSEVPRFQKSLQIITPLQYTSNQNSLINISKNRKYNGSFSPHTNKQPIPQLDKRPFYTITKNEKRQFLAKFSRYEQKRNLFNIKINDEPGPANYCLSPKWQKQSGCVFGKQSKFKTSSTMITQNTQNNSNIFFLASQATLQNTSVQSKSTIMKQRLKTTKRNVKVDNVVQDHFDGYYNISPSWQKKSFNINFVNDILPANNPIKNKIL